MSDEDRSSAAEQSLWETFKTYSPGMARQRVTDSYQPKVPIVVSNETPAPPTGGSGVPAPRANGLGPGSGAKPNGSSE